MYQSGGRALRLTGKYVSKVCDSGSNQMGRWSWITIKGKKDQKITLLSAYRVCENTLAQAGPQTCWLQQWKALKKTGYSDPDPSRQFYTDLNKFIDNQLEKNKELIITMDTNDKKGGDTNLQKFLNKHDLMDAHEQLHHHCTPPNTHQ